MPSGSEIILGDNLEVLPGLQDDCFQLIYIDPPFNTGKAQTRKTLETVPDANGDRTGFMGRRYKTRLLAQSSYLDEFDAYLAFLEPRLREAHRLLEDLADATLDGRRKELMEMLTTVPLLIIDDLGMRKLPLTAAEELLEIIMRRYERASSLISSNRPVEDWGKLLGDSAAVSAMLDRLLHHGHVLKCGPRSWRTKTGSPGEGQ